MKLLPPNLNRGEHTMKRRLLGYMLLLVTIILSALIIALFMFGRFASAKKEISEALDLQMEVFSRDVRAQFEEAAVTGLLLSQETTRTTEQFLSREQLSFSQLRDNAPALARLQDQLIHPLTQLMMRTDCSGAFLALRTTINSSAPNADASRAGLYLQKGNSVDSQTAVLLYRGIADIGKQNGCMPHRKWRMEFTADLLPADSLPAWDSSRPPEQQYRISPPFLLPGTSERAVLLTLPLIDSDGTVYGCCGFEVNQSCFQASLAQPTMLPYLSCLLSDADSSGAIPADSAFSCGVADGYCLPPSGTLHAAGVPDGVRKITGGAIPYLGLIRELSLSPNNAPYTIAVMVPYSYYSHAIVQDVVQIVLLLALLVFFAVTCCLYFSRRFLTPILRGLDRIKSDAPQQASPSGFQEIDDLFGFLAMKDREHEAAIRSLQEETRDARSRVALAQDECLKARDKYATAQAEIARLAYTREQEVDPDEYRLFRAGLEKLTPTEKEIFGYYLQGHSVKEILDIADIKESTLRYHNRNIYSKLGVNSLKQLLRYATLMKWRESEGEDRP